MKNNPDDQVSKMAGNDFSAIGNLLLSKSFLIGAVLSGAVSVGGCGDNIRTAYGINASMVNKPMISADDFRYDKPIGNNSSTFDWKTLSNAKDADGKNLTAWIASDGAKGKVVISGRYVIYSPHMGQKGEDKFRISVMNSFDGKPGSKKDIEITVRGIDTHKNTETVIRGISDSVTYHTKVLPDWEEMPDRKYSATIDGTAYHKGTWISTGVHHISLKTFSSAGELSSEKNVDFVVVESFEPKLDIMDNFRSLHPHMVRPDTDFTLSISGGEVGIRLLDLQIPPEKIGMTLKFDSELMSQNVVAERISFDNKELGLAAIKIRLLPSNTITPHVGTLRIQIQNWSGMSSKDISLTYTAI